AIAGIMVWRIQPIPHVSPPAATQGKATALLDFRPVLKNRPAMGYILGYAAHCWELLGSRSWLVAFISFAAATHGGAAVIAPAIIAAIVNFWGMPASIYGNELAMRHGRRRMILWYMLSSGLMSCVVGFTATLPTAVTVLCLCLYTALVMTDSSSLTAGTVACAAPDKRGSTLALHATLGFGAGIISPTVFGWVLDHAGGNGNSTAWGLAYASQGFFCLIAPLLVLLGRKRWAAVA
ncbi:MAG TPA: hypothetical protein VH105_12830, partial [Burkholderiales bacterium]|nr:hypothetical protein [Burkholderiales bacterium]